MSLNIIVLAKQVPDTRNVGKDAMKEDGTINRAALPAIFNPEDLNALEQALRLKDANPGSTITLLTMGLPRASEIIREAIYRGADTGIVLTDRALGGADTLATSYSLAQAVKKFGNYDIILGGRQAIDGVVLNQALKPSRLPCPVLLQSTARQPIVVPATPAEFRNTNMPFLPAKRRSFPTT